MPSAKLPDASIGAPPSLVRPVTRTRLLVAQAGGRSVGLLVDACREFLTLPPAAIQPPGESLVAMSTRYITGIATLGDRLIVILNLGALLDSAEPILAA